MITPLPGHHDDASPDRRRGRFPASAAEIRNERGETVDVGGGLLALTRPWPSMLRGIYGDPERYVAAVLEQVGAGVYFTGDGAKRDDDGNFWLLGRVDDVLNVAGHRIGTMEVESALVDHPRVAEAAVVGRTHEIKGQAIAAFVTLKEGVHGDRRSCADELKEHVVKKIGAIARPDDILFAADLPKTRSGKIMRRLLRDIAEGKALGDTTTLADPAVVAKLKAKYEEEYRLKVGEPRLLDTSQAVDALDTIASVLLRALDRRFGDSDQVFGVEDVADFRGHADDGAAHGDGHVALGAMVGEPQPVFDRMPHALGEFDRLIDVGP